MPSEKQKTVKSLERQIYILEAKVVEAVSKDPGSKSVYALNGKIKRLKLELIQTKQNEWLAQ